jgi:hypothetical protein
MNPHGQGYCDLFPGDKPFKDYIKMKKDWISKGYLRKCNTLRRFSRECISSHYSKSYAYEFEYKTFKALQYSLIQDAEDCSLKVILPDFYKDQEEFDDSSSTFILPVLLSSFLF